MKGQGFNDVLNLEGGIMAWNGHVATGKPDAGLFLIDGFTTVDEYIALAWALEGGTGKFYRAAEDNFEDAEAKGTFGSLAMVEDKHKANILKAYNMLQGVDMTSKHLEELASIGYMEGGMSLDDAMQWLKRKQRGLQDVLEFSMQLEVNALDLYFKIMNEVEAEPATEIFKSIIDEEKGHLKQLGKLIEKRLES
jgi:rubrerythrin